MRMHLGLLTRLAIAIAGGLAMFAAFPPLKLGWMAIPGVMLVTLAALGARPRRGVLVGATSGLAFFTPLLQWGDVVGVDAWLLLTGLCVLWWGLLGAGIAALSPLRLWPIWMAAWWVLIELLRGTVPLGGFPWGRLGFAQADTSIGRLAAWVGIPGVSLAIALVGTCALAALLAIARQRGMRAAAPWIAACVVLVLAPALLPVGAMPVERTVTIAAIQGGTPQIGMGAFDVRRAVLDNHVRETLELAAEVEQGSTAKPDLVLWPESSSDLDPLADIEAAGAIASAVKAVGVPILLGTRIRAPEDPSRDLNVALAWNPGSGAGERYAKTQLVPFGEYVPFRDVIAPLIGRLDRVGRDLAPGDAPGHLDVAGIPLGTLICFEVAYDSVVAGVMDDPGSAQMIAVLTNNATYALTEQPEQQLEITRMRAIETGRMVIAATTTGITAVIEPDGDVIEQLGELETGFVMAEVPLVTGTPVSSWLGPIVQILAGLLALGAVTAGLVNARKTRGSRSRTVEPS